MWTQAGLSAVPPPLSFASACPAEAEVARSNRAGRISPCVRVSLERRADEAPSLERSPCGPRLGLPQRNDMGTDGWVVLVGLDDRDGGLGWYAELSGRRRRDQYVRVVTHHGRRVVLEQAVRHDHFGPGELARSRDLVGHIRAGVENELEVEDVNPRAGI